MARRRTWVRYRYRSRPRWLRAKSRRDNAFDRPVFIVSPLRSGSTLLFETLAGAPGVYTIGDESHQLIEGVSGLAPTQRGHDSNRLLAEDASPEITASLRDRFMLGLRNRETHRPRIGKNLRMLEKTPKNALRLPFPSTVFPDARCIYLYRDPRQVLGSMIDGWQSGRFAMYPNMAGWDCRGRSCLPQAGANSLHSSGAAVGTGHANPAG